MAELLEKGDIAVVYEDKSLKLIVGQQGKIQNVTVLPVGYVIDKLEEALPGDQKAIAGMLKGALGL